MKIGLLKRNLITAYALVIVLTCLAVGCLRQPGEVISQSSENSNSPLISSSNSSSFNFFQSKKNDSPDESVAKVKVSGTSPILDRIRFDTDSRSHTKVAGNRVTSPANSAEQLQKTARKIVEKRAESWRSKSLIAAAKKYPPQRATTDYQNSDRIKQASSTMPQGISTGIERVSNTGSAASAEQETDQETEQKTPGSGPEHSAADQFRTDEMSRTLDQAAQQDVHPEISQLGKDLHQDLEQAQPAFEDVNLEMRRLQIHSIMERAKREAKSKNYEYAAFLAEQALESSYRGHIAFSPKEESPQMLLQQIKSVMASSEDSKVKPIEHTRPNVQTMGGQKVQNFQFTPSPVHPLTRRSVAKPKEVRSQPQYSTDSNQEMPLIVPRNSRGTGRQTITIPQKRSPVQERRENPRKILLGTPSFEQQTEERSEFPVPEKTHPRNSSSVPNPGLKLELEEIPDEPPAKIRLSGPEAVQQDSIKKIEKPSTPGPQLMLPSLPSVSQDLTSQSEQNQRTQTTPVKFRSKIQENRQNDRDPLVEQKLVGAKGNRPLGKSSLTLDEIEWDLDEKRHPQLRGGWGGMSTLLLIIGGAIILLLLTIIVILLRRGSSSS